MMKMKYEDIVKKGYDELADRYNEARDEVINRSEFGKLIDFMHRGDKVLDVGCGAGFPITKTLVDKGFKTVGIDLSDKMLELANKNVPGAEFIKMNMTEIGFKSKTFHGITAFYSIIHVPRKKHIKIFHEFYRVLKKEGIFLATLGSEEWEAVDNFMGTEMYWSHHDPDKTIRLIEEAGFHILEEHPSTKMFEGDEETHHWVLARKN